MPALLERTSGRIGALLSPAILPAAILVAAWAWWAAADGGFFIRDWAPVGMLLAGLAFAVAAGTGRFLPAAGAARIALLCLAAFVAFAFLSILWAESPGDALDAAAKLVPLLAVCWILALLPWTTRSATGFLGAWAVAMAIVCFVALLEAPGVSDLGGLRTVGRLTTPAGYTNAVAALAWIPLFPALLLAFRAGLPPLVQGVGLGASVLLLEFGLLPQSRGGLVAVVVAGVVMVAACPDRLRLMLRLAVAGALLALASGAILDVQQAADARRGVEAALDDAARAIGLTTLGAIALGTLIGFAERRVGARPGAARAARRAGIAVVALACAAVVVVAVANAGSLFGDLDERWSRLTDEDSSAEGRTSRFTSLDPEGRTDAWRVALDLFESRPVAGYGIGNYGREHTARREVERHSQYVHNVWLRVLAETGVVGALLFVAALACAIAGCIARRRRLDSAGGAVVGVCLAASAMFLAHASLDWLEEFMALALPGLGLLFLGASLRSAGEPEPAPVRRRTAVLAAAGVLPALAIVAMALPWLGTLWTERAFATFRSDPAAAYDDLRRARAVNPLSATAWTSEGTIALALGDERRAASAFRSSIDVEDGWYARLELAVIAAQRGRFAVAARHAEAARRLNKADPAITDARRLIGARRRIDPVRFNARVLRRARSYWTRPEP